ncbi:DSC2 DSC E3 ubiquitin ligase complex subunit 2 [Candida maltosa Xu316]
MTQLTPIRGFTNTPVSRAICILSTIIPISLSVLSIKYLVKFAIDPYIIQYNQFWRIITYQLSVINESDYLISVLLWFQFKVLERFYGSRKYLSMITLFYFYNAIASLFIMSLGQLIIYYVVFAIKVYVLGNKMGTIHYQLTFLNEVIPGPLGILSSLYVCFGTNIPISYYFTILLKKPKSDDQEVEQEDSSPSKALRLTNMFPIHILYTLLILNNGLQSLIPCLVGLLIGKLYTYDLLPGSSSWLIPNIVFQLFINPSKRFNSWVSAIKRRFTRYERVSTEDDSSNGDNSPSEESTEEPDDNDEILDEARQQENRIRAETPVRPLGSQFLDTFRT